jgi:pyruvate kinase
VERVETWGRLARVTSAAVKGVRLKPEKGLNFPDTHLKIAALTDKDLADLDFVAAHADGIGFSFVQSAADVEMLQDALAQRRPNDWHTLSLILKIETSQAVRNLPDIVVRAAGRQPTGIMIARGDLAVEIGFARTAEMQEEILWIGEAAHIPVIWATQGPRAPRPEGQAVARRDDGCGDGRPGRMRNAQQGSLSARGDR